VILTAHATKVNRTEPNHKRVFGLSKSRLNFTAKSPSKMPNHCCSYPKWPNQTSRPRSTVYALTIIKL